MNSFNKDNASLIPSNPLEMTSKEVVIKDDYPILFHGSNSEFPTIFCSLLSYDDDDDSVQYLFVTASEEQSRMYFDGELAYRRIVDTSSIHIICEYDYTESITGIYKVSLNDISPKFLPTYKSFFKLNDRLDSKPLIYKIPGDPHNLNLSIVEFERHIAAIKDCHGMIQSIAPDEIKFDPNIRELRAASLAFVIDIKPQKKTSYINSTKLHELLDIFTSRVATEVLDHPNKPKEEIISSNLDILKEVYLDLGFDYSRDSIKQKVEKGINHYISAIDEINAIDLKTDAGISVKIGEEGKEIELFHYDNEFKAKYESYEEITSSTKQKDKEPKTYSVHIISLNIENRKGKGYVVLTKLHPVKIVIKGKKSLELSEYTRSLHEQDTIVVLAKGTYVDNVIKELEIYPEDMIASESDERTMFPDFVQ